jgi:maltose O-acetyltransferase
VRNETNWKDWLRRRLLAFLDAPKYVRSDFGACASDASVDAGVFISDPRYVHLGSRVTLYRGTKIFCGPGELRVGDGSHLAGDVYVNAVKGKIEIGRGVAVGPKAVLVSYTTHYEHGARIADTHKTGDIRVGDDVFIGAGAIILPGVNIGEGAVIGAGAVVTRDMPSRQVALGVPARPVKPR